MFGNVKKLSCDAATKVDTPDCRHAGSGSLHSLINTESVSNIQHSVCKKHSGKQIIDSLVYEKYKRMKPKFEPVCGTDIIMTKYQSIMADKSFEELRYEDYEAVRKVVQGTTENTHPSQISQTNIFDSQEKVLPSLIKSNSAVATFKKERCPNGCKNYIRCPRPEKKCTSDLTETIPNLSLNSFANIVEGNKKHPCGIICTRPEYYTLPSLQALPEFRDRRGRCVIKGFVIGRKGYGNVYFLDEMDITDLNIDELIHFKHREINVYPDESQKPRVGQGLNRSAQVTLDNIYPCRAGTNELVKNIKELTQIDFIKKLEKITAKKNARFIEYRPQTGSWVFKVKHFSRYGFDDSDEESELNQQETAKKKGDAIPKKSDVALQGQKVAEEQKRQAPEQTDKVKEVEGMKLGIDDEILVEDDDHFQGDEDLLEQSMYVDHLSEDDYNAIPSEIPMNLPYDSFSTSSNIQVMKSTLFAEDDRSSDGGGSHISIIRQYLDIPDIPRLPVLREEIAPKKRIILKPRVMKVYNFGGSKIPPGILPSRCYKDTAMFKGKSFKVGWTSGFNFYKLNGNGEINGHIDESIIDYNIATKFNPLEECLKDSLEIVLEECSCNLDDKRIPTFKILQGETYLKKQIKLFSDMMTRSNNKESQFLYSIWTLADALWGPGEESFSSRRHLLSEWLKYNTSYNEAITNAPTKDIFNLLSVFKTLEASNLALEKRYPKLCLLISQLSVTNRTKLFLQEQIEAWYKSLTANHINEDMKRIYLLLAGIPHKGDVNIFQDIDWKRAFGMHLWYISPVGSPVEVAIDLYKKAFEMEGYAEPPNPPYQSEFMEQAPFDVLYHILLLYKTRVHRLSSVLNPATHTDDPLDYRLSWLLLQLFTSLNVGIIETSEKNKLCTSFSNQLESLGEWEWAVFILLHLEDNALKTNLVMGVLDRNLSPETDEIALQSADMLINKLCIPPEWIHIVKGEKTLYLERYFEAFNHLAYAGDYCKANDILIKYLIPNLFINEQYDVINMLINSIRTGAENILHWNYEAGLFSDFLDLQENVISFKSEDLLKLQVQLQSINERIGNFQIETDQQKLCVAEMSKRCASVYKEICKKSHSNLFISSYSNFIETLVMPPDFNQNEAFCLINSVDNFTC